MSVSAPILQQQQARRRQTPVQAPEPTTPEPAPARRFTVWCGSSIGAQHHTIEDLAAATYALLPPGVWDEVELLMKAGEGGSWQSAFDPHPLAISGAATLLAHVQQARPFGLRISPYIVVRARPAWAPGEQAMIRACVGVAGRCNLNVEPGAQYYNGPNDPAYIREYIAGAGVPADTLEVTLIPRAGQVAELGGAACIQAWTDPSLVGSASWETYGITAGVSGASSLLVNEAIPRLDGWGVPPEPQYRIPIPQRDERLRWADTPWCAYGMQVWFQDGN